MKVKLGNYDIRLNKNDVKQARQAVAKIVNGMKQVAKDCGRPSFYFTFLIVCHVYTGELIKAYKPEQIQKVMEYIIEDAKKK